jgi:cell division transport system ATP-binding protein
MIIFEHVSVQFPNGNVALKGVSFKIPDNDFVFLVGPSGAGKTTILKLILGSLRSSEGLIQVNDFDLSNNFHSIDKLRRRIGVVFQDFKVLPDKNVFENVALALRVEGARRSFIEKEVAAALELVSLSHKSNMFPSQMSAGELQRVAIARSIVGDRDILLADEPTGNLDPKTSWEIMKIFKKLEGKKTILIATHNTDIVNSLRKRVFVMKEGSLAKDLKKGGYDL